ncbi:hypothetical protein JJB07_16725 [Tumebacillus sp. ITR2]|uniref:SH3b domain-containing protein n=1 Tax=Tumebacillus amylolyticus TaxID=2801339 RepID=A0ABS1JDF4_9BACL|nr:hypothetical protein [Tumebacillus amylolyticus]MBL0388260.1 hypothetical protein [Tumebacillus amylolyticus]
MKKGLLSALTLAAAFALVAAPATIVPTSAYAADGTWNQIPTSSSYITTSYTTYRAFVTDGGDVKVSLVSNSTGGSVYARLVNQSGTVIGGAAPISGASSMVWTGMKAGSTVIVELKTTGSAGYVLANIWD